MVFSKLKTYGELVMFSHTLFSVPFGFIAMFIAASGLPSPWVTSWIVTALLSARTAANAMNRLIDRDIDARNPRTAGRHMPMGLVSVREVVLLIAACLILLTLSAFMLNSLCVILLPIPLIVFLVYSFSKRFTYLCHLILGVACGAAPVGAWIGVTKSISLVAILLGAIVTMWVAGFDIIYGAQDVEFDRSEGLYSIPASFGIKNALMFSTLLHIGAVVLLISLKFFTGMGWIYIAGVAVTALLLLYEHLIVSPDNLKNVTIASYSVNQVVSMVMLIFTSADIFLLG